MYKQSFSFFQHLYFDWEYLKPKSILIECCFVNKNKAIINSLDILFHILLIRSEHSDFSILILLEMLLRIEHC